MPAFDLEDSFRRARARLDRTREASPDHTDVVSVATLPPEVRAALLHVDMSATAYVSLGTVAFYAFNYGALRALTFASALPNDALESAASLPGWRPKSLALLRAIVRYRSQTA